MGLFVGISKWHLSEKSVMWKHRNTVVGDHHFVGHKTKMYCGRCSLRLMYTLKLHRLLFSDNHMPGWHKMMWWTRFGLWSLTLTYVQYCISQQHNQWPQTECCQQVNLSWQHIVPTDEEDCMPVSGIRHLHQSRDKADGVQSNRSPHTPLCLRNVDSVPTSW